MSITLLWLCSIFYLVIALFLMKSIQLLLMMCWLLWISLENDPEYYCLEQVYVVLDGSSILSACLYFSNDNGKVLVEHGKYHFVRT